MGCRSWVVRSALPVEYTRPAAVANVAVNMIRKRAVQRSLPIPFHHALRLLQRPEDLHATVRASPTAPRAVVAQGHGHRISRLVAIRRRRQQARQRRATFSASSCPIEDSSAGTTIETAMRAMITWNRVQEIIATIGGNRLIGLLRGIADPMRGNDPASRE